MSEPQETLNINHLIEGTADSDLLQLTINQLRQYVALCHARTQAQATRLLGQRHASTVREGRKAVERAIAKITGEGPFTKPTHRGGEFRLTPRARLLQEHAEQILWHIFVLTEELKRPRPVRLALTNYMTEVPAIQRILQVAQAELEAGISLRHIDSHEIASVLKERVVDFVLSGTLTTNGQSAVVDRAISFLRLRRLQIGLLSNYEIVQARSTKDLLLQEKEFLVRPTHGIFLEVLQKRLGRQMAELTGPHFDNTHFALDVLRFRLYPQACMIVDSQLAGIIIESLPPGKRKHLRFLPFEDGAETQIGAFRLKEPKRRIRPRQGNRQGIKPIENSVEAFQRILEQVAQEVSRNNL